jgi:hypothetical protein
MICRTRVVTSRFAIALSACPDLTLSLTLQYTAPTDDALLFDLQVVKQFGLNAIRLHQKVNPQRWYLHADTVGVVILQDMIQVCARMSSSRT